MLQLTNISKSYRIGNTNESILKNIQLSFQPGEFVSLLGPSGSGKSTILNIIGGLDTADEGALYFRDTDTASFKEKDWDAYRKNHIGFVFQNFNLIPHLTALENVEITLTLSGLTKQQRREQAAELLKKVGLEDRMHQKPNELSGGQKQRVAIARALSNNPDIILADEPTGALDSKTADSIVGLLKDIADAGKLVIVVTHSKELTEKTGRVVELKDGVIISDVQKVSSSATIEQKKPSVFSRLPYSTTLKLAGKNLWKKRWRTALTSLGASIGITGIVVMMGIGFGAQEKLNDELSFLKGMKAISVTVDETEEKAFSNKDIQAIEQMTGVKDVIGSYQFQSSIQYQDHGAMFFMNASAEPEADKKGLLAGRMAKDVNELVITEKTATELAGGTKKYKHLLNKEVTVTTLLHDPKAINQTIQEKAKIVGILTDGPFGINYGYVSVSYSDYLAKKSAGDSLKQTSLVVLTDTLQVVPKVKKQLDEKNWTAITADEQLKQIKQYTLAIQAVLALFAGISLIVSTIMIGIVLYIAVLERTKEIGILKSIGARRKDIRRIFLSEAAVIGLIGGTIGVAGAALVGSVINIGVDYALKENSFQVFILPTWLSVAAILFSVFISVIAGFIPSQKASKLKAIDALRYE